MPTLIEHPRFSAMPTTTPALIKRQAFMRLPTTPQRYQASHQATQSLIAGLTNCSLDLPLAGTSGTHMAWEPAVPMGNKPTSQSNSTRTLREMALTCGRLISHLRGIHREVVWPDLLGASTENTA